MTTQARVQHLRHARTPPRPARPPSYRWNGFLAHVRHRVRRALLPGNAHDRGGGVARCQRQTTHQEEPAATPAVRVARRRAARQRTALACRVERASGTCEWNVQVKKARRCSAHGVLVAQRAKLLPGQFQVASAGGVEHWDNDGLKPPRSAPRQDGGDLGPCRGLRVVGRHRVSSADVTRRRRRSRHA